MRQRLFDALTKNILLKLTALGLAFLLWTIVKTDNQVAIDGMPIQVQVRDAGWAQMGIADPPTATVDFSGPVRQLIRVAAERPPIVLTVDEVTDSMMVLPVRMNAISLGPGMEDTRVEAIRPLTVAIRLDRVIVARIPVTAMLVGSPMPGYERAGPAVLDPVFLRATGPRRILAQLDTIRLPPIDMSQRTTTDTLLVTVDSVPREVTLDLTEVRVIVPVRPVAPDTTISPMAPGDGTVRLK